MNKKSTVAQIQARFDADVDRFSNLETGHSATIDAPLVMDLVTWAAAESNPNARSLLDVGCGAGNYTIKLLQRLPILDITLVDLSHPMLRRATQRISPMVSGSIVAIQGDIRLLEFDDDQFDIILAAAVLHHLRNDNEWESIISKFFRILKPGGTLWVSDLVDHSNPAVQRLMWHRYGCYLSELRDESYRDQVFAYIEQEDTPRSLLYQVELMRSVGFSSIEILHKNGPFAAFGGIK